MKTAYIVLFVEKKRVLEFYLILIVYLKEMKPQRAETMLDYSSGRFPQKKSPELKKTS